MQWSKLGRPVHLIDKSEQQLERAQTYIQGLRESASAGSNGWGSVNLFNADRLKEAISSTWLIVEVSELMGHEEAKALKHEVCSGITTTQEESCQGPQ